MARGGYAAAVEPPRPDLDPEVRMAWESEATHLLEPEDTATEVSAAFRTQRRVATAYLVLFLGVIVMIPVLNSLVGWWTTGRLLGGISPAFAWSTAGLYLVIITIGVLGARVADQVERRMLGGRELLEHDSTLDQDELQQ